MRVMADQHKTAAGRGLRPALVIVAAAVGLIVAAGLLMWWRHGAAVFGDMVLAAVAWCF